MFGGLPRILIIDFSLLDIENQNSVVSVTIKNLLFCVFLYRPFCHSAHKLDLSTLFTIFFSLNISSIYIILQ